MKTMVILLTLIAITLFSFDDEITWAFNIYQDGKRVEFLDGKIVLKRKPFLLRLTAKHPVPFAVLNIDTKDTYYNKIAETSIYIGSENPDDLFYKYKVYAYDFDQPKYLVIGDYGYHPLYHDLKKRNLTWTHLRVTEDLYIYELLVNRFVDQNNEKNNVSVEKTKFKALYLIFAVDNESHKVEPSDLKRYTLYFKD